MTPDLGRSVPATERGLANGARAVPLTVLFVLALDVLTTPVGQALGVSDLGPTGLLAELQRLLLVAAAAATMWNRSRAAVVLTAAVVVLVFTAGPTGEELWLYVITGVTAAIRASRWQIGLVVLAQLGYAAGFGWQLSQSYPGEGWAMAPYMIGFAGGSLLVGLVARRLLRARDRRRRSVVELEAQQGQIRALERARLADELQTLATSGLATIEAELDLVTRGPADLDNLRSGLTQIDRHSRALLVQLRALLGVLRPDQAHDSGHRSPAANPAPSHWVDRLTARHVRVAATVVLVLLAARAMAGHPGSLPAAGLVVQVIGFSACAVAVWRPVPAAVGAGAVLPVALVFDAGGSGALLSTTLLCLVAAVCFGPRNFWGTVSAVVGYAFLVALTGPPDPTRHVLLVVIFGFLATAAGLAARHFIAARKHATGQLVHLAQQRELMESQERSAVARELHDVVAHSLSVTTMLVMATSLSDDAERLAETVEKVRRSTEATHHELSALLGAMRRADIDTGELTPLVTPLAAAAALVQRLRGCGYQPVLDIDPAANALDPTAQRTMSRVMQEATTNILRYTPAGSSCRFALVVDDTVARLRIESPLAATERSSDYSLGWGLRGIQERVELTAGTFAAGPDRGRWVLDVMLPTVQAVEASLVH